MSVPEQSLNPTEYNDTHSLAIIIELTLRPLLRFSGSLSHMGPVHLADRETSSVQTATSPGAIYTVHTCGAAQARCEHEPLLTKQIR